MFLSLAIGHLIGSNNLLNDDKPAPVYESVQKLNQLLIYLSNDYVDKINTDSIVGVVIEEIVNELDPHSVYIPVVQKQALSESGF